MGQLSVTPSPWAPARGPWSRLRRRHWVRPDYLASVTGMFAAIPLLPRAELAGLPPA